MAKKILKKKGRKTKKFTGFSLDPSTTSNTNYPETYLVHFSKSKIFNSINSPIFMSSTFPMGENETILYSRNGNTPNQVFLHEKIKKLDEADFSLTTATGMSAISITLIALLNPGDHVLLQKGTYGATHTLISDLLSRWGIQFSIFNGENLLELEKNIKPNTKLVYAESISNPLLKIIDHYKLIAFCKKNKLLSVIDNTLATPLGFHALKIGYDVVLHSGTKYLNGHSDLLFGVISSKIVFKEKIEKTYKLLGSPLDPFSCFLVERGLKTLPIRLEKQTQNTQKLLCFLKKEFLGKKISAIYYPTETPIQFTNLYNSYGAVLSFEVIGDKQEAMHFCRRLKLFSFAPSLGGVESLCTLPALTSHSTLSNQERKKMGISNSLVRFSIGIENIEDLKIDIKQAFQ